MTVATVIYYAGVHPYTLKPVYTPKTKQEKRQQHMFFFWHKRENHRLIREKLISIGREDLIEKLIDDQKKFRKKEYVKKRSEVKNGKRKKRYGRK
jgi:hypothetical protein